MKSLNQVELSYSMLSTQKKAKVDATLNTCTPELLASAGLPQDFYAAGHDLVWDVVNGWLSKGTFGCVRFLKNISIKLSCQIW